MTRRVLIVDDQVAVAGMFQGLLAKAGYAAETAANGLEALSVLDWFDPCLILLDLAMPVMDGNEFLTWIDAVNRPRVIVMSGYAIDVRPELLGRVDARLDKPFGNDVLLRAVEAALRKS